VASAFSELLYGFIPSYLTNYEMVVCPDFQRFAKAVLRRGAAEIGMHLHAWNSPPIISLTGDDYASAPYLIEYAPEIIHRKVSFMTAPCGRRSNAKSLAIVPAGGDSTGFMHGPCRSVATGGDCSVTPGVSWAAHRGGLSGGPDYQDVPRHPYFLDFEDVRREGYSGLLEVPMTVVPEKQWVADWFRPLAKDGSLASRALNRVAPEVRWMQSNGRNRRRL
jgi:hypothetical protein